MERTTAVNTFAGLPQKLSHEEYNYAHFSRADLVFEARGTMSARGIAPGTPAPDFELEDTDGRKVRLSQFFGRPLLLRFGSFTCPGTIGSLEPLKNLYAQWKDRVQFVEILIRQSHPGPEVPRYDTYAQKAAEARRYKSTEQIPWTVLVDDLQGTVHQAYGGLSDPTYVLNGEGVVAFYDTWTHAPTLHRAFEALLGPHKAYVVDGGVDKLPHMLAPIFNGWPAIARGLPQSFDDLQRAVPGMAPAMQNAYRLKPKLDPLVTRSAPLPRAVRLGLWAVGFWVLYRLIRGR
jgi:hypothetical protein